MGRRCSSPPRPATAVRLPSGVIVPALVAGHLARLVGRWHRQPVHPEQRAELRPGDLAVAGDQHESVVALADPHDQRLHDLHAARCRAPPPPRPATGPARAASTSYARPSASAGGEGAWSVAHGLQGQAEEALVQGRGRREARPARPRDGPVLDQHHRGVARQVTASGDLRCEVRGALPRDSRVVGDAVLERKCEGRTGLEHARRHAAPLGVGDGARANVTSRVVGRLAGVEPLALARAPTMGRSS